MLSEKRVITKNIWTAQLYILEKYGVDPPKAKYHFIGIKALVKPLYCSKTKKTFVKEKKHLSREIVSVFTQVCNNGKCEAIS